MKPSSIQRSVIHWYSWNTFSAAPLLPIQSPGQTSSADHSCQNWVFQYISIVIVTASNDIFIASINIVIVLILALAKTITVLLTWVFSAWKKWDGWSLQKAGLSSGRGDLEEYRCEC